MRKLSLMLMVLVLFVNTVNAAVLVLEVDDAKLTDVLLFDDGDFEENIYVDYPDDETISYSYSLNVDGEYIDDFNDKIAVSDVSGELYFEILIEDGSLVTKDLNLCNYNNKCDACLGVSCDVMETAFTCSDCDAEKKDKVCVDAEDGFCDPDCFEDLDCDVQKIVEKVAIEPEELEEADYFGYEFDVEVDEDYLNLTESKALPVDKSEYYIKNFFSKKEASFWMIFMILVIVVVGVGALIYGARGKIQKEHYLRELKFRVKKLYSMGYKKEQVEKYLKSLKVTDEDILKVMGEKYV
jgi:hypothetical protein